jgi:hypothetical protein
MDEREQRMFTLLHDAAYVLAMEAEGTIKRKQFDDWRTGWLNEMGRLMIEMIAEQGKQVKEKATSGKSREKGV